MPVDKITVTCPECRATHVEFVPYGHGVNIRFCRNCDKHFRLQAMTTDGKTFWTSKCTNQPVIFKAGESPPPPKEKPRFATGGFTTSTPETDDWIRESWSDYFDKQAAGSILEELERIKRTAYKFKMNPNAKRK